MAHVRTAAQGSAASEALGTNDSAMVTVVYEFSNLDY